MGIASLDELHGDIINRLLPFMPSIWQLLQFEMTSKRHRSLTLDHMKLMTVVDLRTTAKLDEGVVKQMETFVCERFSLKVNKMVLEQWFQTSYARLKKEYPQLFLSQLFQSSNPTLFHGDEDEPQKPLGQLLGILQRNDLSVTYTDYSIVIALPERISLCAWELEACFNIVNTNQDKLLNTQDLASVREIEAAYFGTDPDKLTERLASLSSIFPGLKRISVEAGLYHDSFDVDMAIDFKEFIAKSKVDICLKFYECLYIRWPVEEILKMIGPHITFLKYSIIDTPSDCLSFCYNLRELEIGGIAQVFEDIPASVTRLHVHYPKDESLDNLLHYFGTNGHRLETLSVMYPQIVEKHQLVLLLDKIADTCVSLKTLTLDDFHHKLVYPVDKLCHLLDKVGPKLTALSLICRDADISLVQTLVLSCKSLKHLKLQVGQKGDLDISTACEPLKTMSKLECATIEIGMKEESRIEVNYRNQKMASPSFGNAALI